MFGWVKNKTVKILISVIILFVIILGLIQLLSLRKAHSTFENYYAFRGCNQILNKTSDHGTCKTNTGQTIKIVKYNNKWYLDGDLPWGCLGKVCFGW